TSTYGQAPSCQDVTCNQGEECVLRKVNCFLPPCYPFPICESNNKTTTKG
ncbi:unnamed protein product, partial [Allacma fusca]